MHSNEGGNRRARPFSLDTSAMHAVLPPVQAVLPLPPLAKAASLSSSEPARSHHSHGCLAHIEHSDTRVFVLSCITSGKVEPGQPHFAVPRRGGREHRARRPLG